jgi:vacuolar-type H+-ATPase subunit F/Vma7
MKKSVVIALFAVLMTLLLVGFTRIETITAEAVEDYLIRMEEAFNKRDADAIAVLIASDARIELEQTVKGSTERMSLSRDEYRTGLAGGLPSLEGYRYTMKNKSHAIADDAQFVMVTVKVVESYADKGKRITNETDCAYKLVLKRGRLMAIAISAKGRER